ncbi:hypothetical protein GUJ93_ZPchr0186g16424 [Zizania palustris]|uniref:Uncharacterized protein n=1 Tax=Zizania palustris TaxID=103762 RepID=A0A8J5QXL0_ZIZPA|nr:hypothetical protein GUJ93_ZPchr0186g16424 [Zizania palustris]
MVAHDISTCGVARPRRGVIGGAEPLEVGVGQGSRITSGAAGDWAKVMRRRRGCGRGWDDVHRGSTQRLDKSDVWRPTMGGGM